MKYKLLLTLISVALFSQSVLAAKGGNKPAPQQNIPEPGQAVYVDANGTMLGDVQTGVGGSYDSTKIYFGVNEKYYVTTLDEDYSDGVSSVVFQGRQLYYDQPGCTGNAYIRYGDEIYGDIIFPRGGREGVLYAQSGDTPQTRDTMSSWWSDNVWEFSRCIYDPDPTIQCIDITEEINQCIWEFEEFYPAAPIVDTNIYTEPFRL